MTPTLKIYEFYKPLFNSMAEHGLNVSSVKRGMANDTVYVEIEEWTNLFIDKDGFLIYQGDKKFYFDSTFYLNISV